MRIVHVSTHDVTGGAARAAYRLHRGLLEIGEESRMLVLSRKSGDATVEEFRPAPRLSRRVGRAIRHRRIAADFASYAATRPPGHEQFSDDRTAFAGEVARRLPPADLVNLHWIAGMVDLRSFLRSWRSLPLVWTLHDMNAFTGGCHYDEGCGRFVASCGACPQLGSSREDDLSRDIWRRKRDAYGTLDTSNVQVVANSRWLADEARRSSLLSRFPISTIHLGLDTQIFFPHGQSAARKKLGVPEEARVLLFVADSVTNRRKGFAYLAAALERLRGMPDLFLISIGRGAGAVPLDIPHLHVDAVDNDRHLASIYSAADLFVIPSLQEAYGQTALEAMSCGVPSVGFAVGGIPDAIRAGVTGLLAEPADAESLASAIAELLSNREARLVMGENCRRIAVDEHSLAVQAKQYSVLYQRILNPN